MQVKKNILSKVNKWIDEERTYQVDSGEESKRDSFVFEMDRWQAFLKREKWLR